MILQMKDHCETEQASRLEKLLITLEEIVCLYQQLLITLQEEKGLIIDGNLVGLSDCLMKKEKFLEDLKQLELLRLSQMKGIEGISFSGEPEGATLARGATPARGATLGGHSAFAKGDEMTLRQLAGLVPVPYRARFLSCYERLRALSASVSEINQVNGLLSVRILQQVSSLLGLLTHLSAGPSIYQSSGFLRHDLQGGYALRTNGMFHLRG